MHVLLFYQPMKEPIFAIFWTKKHIQERQLVALGTIFLREKSQEVFIQSLYPIIFPNCSSHFFFQLEMKLERQQILSLFIKSMKKFYKYLYTLSSKEIESTMPRLKEVSIRLFSILCYQSFYISLFFQLNSIIFFLVKFWCTLVNRVSFTRGKSNQ